MHDAATVHYSALVDNMAFGMKNLHDWFGTPFFQFQFKRYHYRAHDMFLPIFRIRIYFLPIFLS